LLSLNGSMCDRSTDAMIGMAGMPDMPGMDMGSAPPASGGQQQAPHKDGCNLPWATGCTSAAPCGPTVTITMASTRTTVAFEAADVRGVDARAPESPALAPELPPPRS
jgi:hypothetical protein